MLTFRINFLVLNQEITLYLKKKQTVNQLKNGKNNLRILQE